MRRGRKSIIRMMIAMMLSLIVWLNVKPMEAAAAENDVGVIGVKAEDGKITATLYGYSGDSNSVAVSFYRDGKKAGETKEASVRSNQRTTVDSDADIVLKGEDIHYYTVVISDDANWSNNNRTLILGKDSGGTTKPDQPEEPEKKAELALGSIVSPTDATAGQTISKITVQVKNTGDAAAANVQVTATVNGETFTGIAAGIAANSSANIELTGSWTPNSAGSYSVSVSVKADNVALVTSTVGNISVGEQQKPEGQLTIIGLVASAATWEPGQTYTVTVTVKNEVENSNPASGTVDFLLNGASIGQESVSDVAAGQSKEVVLNYKLPDNYNPGSYILAVGEKTVMITVPETSQQESGLKKPTIKNTMTAFTAATLTWGYDEGSEGEVPAKYTIEIGGQTHTANEVGSHTFTGLEMGKTYTYTVTAESSDGKTQRTENGTVTLKAQNALVSGKTDVIISDVLVEPESPVEGSQVVFKAVITNQGSIKSKDEKHGIRFYVDNENYSDGDFYWSDQQKQGIAPGESVIVTANGSYQTTTGQTRWTAAKVGNHFVKAYIEPDNSAGDGDTNNNSYKKIFTVSSAQPPVDIPIDNANADNVNVAAQGCYGDRENSSIRVLVNGKESPSINAWVNTACLWNVGNYETTPLTIFEMKSESVGAKVRVALPSSEKVNSAIVRPLSSGIEAKVVRSDSGSYVEFEVKKWGSYSVEFNGETSGALQVFVNPEYKEGQYGGKYLPLGTVTWDTAGFGGTVYGSGILRSNHQGAVVEPGSGAGYYGITILNEYQTGYGGQGSWEVQVPDRNDIEFNYFHIIACSPNSDGISIQSSNNIRINNSYFRTWDDGVVLKNYSGGNTHDITVKNCVFWTDLAQSMEIGAETNKSGWASKIYKANFEDIDVIHSNHKPALSIHNMDNITVSDIHWKNVTIEDAQMGNNHGYGDGWPLIIDVTNVRGGEVPGTDAGWTRQWNRGTIENVTFENINVLSWQNDRNLKPGVRIMNSEYGGTIKDITITNLNYKGERVTSESALRNSSTIFNQFAYRSDMAHEGSYLTTFGCNGKHSADDYVIENFRVN